MKNSKLLQRGLGTVALLYLFGVCVLFVKLLPVLLPTFPVWFWWAWGVLLFGACLYAPKFYPEMPKEFGVRWLDTPFKALGSVIFGCIWPGMLLVGVLIKLYELTERR